MPTKSQTADELWVKVSDQIAFKQNEWEPYLQTCDKYVAGFRHNRKWETSKKPRSNIKLHTTSDVIETLYSRILFQLFYSGGEDFFDLVSDNPATSRAFTQRLRFLLHAPIDVSGRTSFYALKQSLRSILQYGMGVVSLTYNIDLERPTLAPISVYDLYWSPTTSGWLDDSPEITLKKLIPIDALENYRGLP